MYVTYAWNLKERYTRTYKEVDSQKQKTGLELPQGKKGGIG